MRSSSTRTRLAQRIWVVVLLAALVVTASSVSSQGWLVSNVFELLPKSEYDPLTEAATRTVDAEHRFETRMTGEALR